LDEFLGFYGKFVKSHYLPRRNAVYKNLV